MPFLYVVTVVVVLFVRDLRPLIDAVAGRVILLNEGILLAVLYVVERGHGGGLGHHEHGQQKKNKQNLILHYGLVVYLVFRVKQDSEPLD